MKYYQVKIEYKFEPTYVVTIFIGLQEGYDGIIHTYEEVLDVCQGYVDKIGLAVNVSKCDFVYTKGREAGARIELIQYPRFPRPIDVIEGQAFNLCEILMEKFNQIRASLITPTNTYTLERCE